MPDYAQIPETAQAKYIKPVELEGENFTIKHIGERENIYLGKRKMQWVLRIELHGEEFLLTLDKSANRDANMETIGNHLPVTNVTLTRADGKSKAWIFAAAKKGKK